MAEQKKKEQPKVSAEDFVKAWQKASSVAEVSKATGISESSVRFRVARYRKAGVNLKKFARAATAKLDVEALNKLASELL